MKLSRYPLLLAVLTSWLLVACGGGSSSPPPPPPAAPTGVSAIAKDGYVLVDATIESGATGANVYYGTTASVSTSSNKVKVGSSPQAVTGLTNGQTYYFIVTALNAGGESAATTAVSAVPQTTSLTGDPFYVDQWHLKSTGTQAGASSTAAAGEDLNVEPAWTNTIPSVTNKKGEGVRVAVVDDGLEIGHEDLASNMAANDQSYNYVTGSNDPTNSPSDTGPGNGHGTAVAGIIAARDENGLGVKGVAPRATLVGYNLLQNSTTTNEADAMTRNAAAVSISSNSWGAADGTGLLDASSSLWTTAINTGLTNGRGGKGSVYMWAAGNGAAKQCTSTWVCSDNSNYDGRANYRGVMAVAAVDDKGKQSSYSESGANLWISAPGGGGCTTHTITTTDRTGSVGLNPPNPATGYVDYVNTGYTRCMNGTSAATPGASGVVALMLAANPNLGWRDVRIILAQTARKNDAGDAGWVLTSGTQTPKYWFNHKYGFGVADAAAAVSAASGWTNVVAEVTYTTPLSTPAKPIPDNDLVTGASDTITVAGSNISSIEFVEITFTATNTPYSGDLEVTLTSPNGTVSVLAVPHNCAGASGSCTSTYNGWVFGSARHLGEAANGAWTLTAYDGVAGGTGTFSSWKLKFYGR